MDLRFAIFLFSIILKVVFSKVDNRQVDLLGPYRYGGPKYQGIENSTTENALSFGSQTNNLIIRGQNVKTLFTGFKQHEDKTFVVAAKLDKIDESGKSTLISVKSPWSDKKFFEVFIQQSESVEHVLEGKYFRGSQSKVQFSIGIFYISDDGIQRQTISLEDRFKFGKWFTLMLRVLDNSHIVLYLDCEKIATEKLFSKVAAIPSYGEVRLAQNIQEDFWSSEKQITNRFIGEMKEAKFLFGKESFETLSPCSQINEIGMAIEGTPSKEEGPDSQRLAFSFESFFGEMESDCYVNFETYKNGQTWNNVILAIVRMALLLATRQNALRRCMERSRRKKQRK